jgi:hypothetical protein
MKQARRGPSWALKTLKDQCHINQLGNKIIKSKGNNLNRVEDINVFKQGTKNIRKKTVQKTMQSTKMSECKKKKNLITRSPWHVLTNEINLLKASDGWRTKEAKV